MKVVLKPGDTLHVELHETDGYFEIDYGGTALTVYSDLPDTDGRSGVIYSENYAANMADDVKAEEPVTLHGEEVKGFDGPDTSKPWCYTIPLEQNTGLYGGYVPSMVVEDDPNHYPMLGKGDHAAPWVWGEELEQALRICTNKNNDMGISHAEADRIIGSSMRAALREAS